MIDPAIFRTAPERYARERELREQLTPEEREVVQDEIARRWHLKRDELEKTRFGARLVPAPASDATRRLWRVR